ncbi:M56 family metallopeptidase [Flavobacterium sp. FBOR7N2.3]|uniref:M56 family metallopeptidase n=1 Tax=Flavobacterium magnesitis TaxID=3138077 RepID=A0ABV4TN09_9FLAO
MESGFIYLIKASGLIGLFYFAYFLLLRKETFFSGNRWFLLLGLITSSVLPLFFITKIIWVEPTTDSLNLSDIHRVISATAIENITTNKTSITNNGFEINYYWVLEIVYSIGILALLIKFAFEFYTLRKIIKDKTIHKQANFNFINVTENIAPFSYFNYIVYNSSLYTTIELENILEHEKVHSEQKHSVDVLISRLFCVIFWFNPFIWLYKKAIAQNLEFIADKETAKKITDKKAYQYTLLKITTEKNCVALTNHFYQSLIKKRIIMLNKNESNKRNSWKYAIVLPILGAFLFFFQIKVVAQEKVTSTEIKESQSNKAEIKTIKNENDSNALSKEKKNNIIVKKDIEKTDVSTDENPALWTMREGKPFYYWRKEFYIDGVKSTYLEYRDLDINTIEVNTKFSNKQVRVTTKKTDLLQSPIVNEEGKEQKGKNGSVIGYEDGNGKSSYYFDFDKALVILDGKDSDYTTLLKNKDKKLNCVYFCPFKAIPHDESKKAILAEYGEKARNGVIIVETQDYYNKNN